MDYLTSKYINLLSSQLSYFKRKTANLYNFRCPYCNDSKRNKRKTRGYVYEKEGNCFFICHNCSVSKSFDNFLKEQDYRIFCEYIKEKIYPTEKEEEIEIKMKAPIFNKNIGLPSIKSLYDNHPAKYYLYQRKIPEEFLDEIYWCKDFKYYVNGLIPEKFPPETLKVHEEGRILLPFYTPDKKLFGFSGRSIDSKTNLRYINIILDESQPKLFGMERWNKNERTFVVEGPLDSLFLPNCLATMGNDMVAALRDLEEYKNNFIIFYDNEPRSPEINHKIKKAIDAGYQVCFWPSDIIQKDINDLVLSGYDIDSIMKILDNPLKNFNANLKLFSWSKI